MALSSEKSHKTCTPRPMPKSGCVRFFIAESRPRSRKYRIALDASPTPGKITLSAEFKVSASSVKIGSDPKRLSAFLTDLTFPALRSEERRVGKECRFVWAQ